MKTISPHRWLNIVSKGVYPGLSCGQRVVCSVDLGVERSTGPKVGYQGRVRYWTGCEVISLSRRICLGNDDETRFMACLSYTTATSDCQSFDEWLHEWWDQGAIKEGVFTPEEDVVLALQEPGLNRTQNRSITRTISYTISYFFRCCSVQRKRSF